MRTHLGLISTLLFIQSCGESSQNIGQTISLNELNSDAGFIELIDPTPGDDDQFGQTLLVLANGNIVVHDPNDSSIADSAGAVHLYQLSTGKLISSTYADDPEDHDVSVPLIETNNSNTQQSENTALRTPFISAGTEDQNFVVNIFKDDLPGIQDAGSVRLFSGATGEQIGETIHGEHELDNFGFSGVHKLSNGNYVIASPLHNAANLEDSGSITLVDGNTGSIIGTPITGDNPHDRLAYSDLNGDGTALDGIHPLPNGNFLILSQHDDHNGLIDAGSIMLVDGNTGNIIASLYGDDDNDQIGLAAITVLDNGHIVIYSGTDNHNGLSFAGSVRILNTSTGGQLGNTYYGSGGINSTEEPRLYSSVQTLVNGNIAILSGRQYTDTQQTDHYILLDSHSGNMINDQIQCERCRLYGLNNGNLVQVSIGSQSLNSTLFEVALLSGSTGLPTGSSFGELELGESIGHFDLAEITPLSNGNYIFLGINAPITQPINLSGSPSEPTTSDTTAVVDGESNEIITVISKGSDPSNTAHTVISPLNNGNVVVRLPYFDVGGLADAGKAILIDQASGQALESSVAGAAEGDKLGLHFFQLQDSSYLVGSWDISSAGYTQNGGLIEVDADTNIPTSLAIQGMSDYASIPDYWNFGIFDHSAFVLSYQNQTISRYDQNLMLSAPAISLSSLISRDLEYELHWGNYYNLENTDIGEFYLYSNPNDTKDGYNAAGTIYLLDF